MHISTSALQAFRDQCGGSNPSSTSAASDGEKLLSLKEEVVAKYGISTDIITEEFSKYAPWHDWMLRSWGGLGWGKGQYRWISWCILPWELDGITSLCCLLIGQYPHHMTLCPPVAIVKRCYGICLYATAASRPLR